jgi:hypothetical protein
MPANAGIHCHGRTGRPATAEAFKARAFVFPFVRSLAAPPPFSPGSSPGQALSVAQRSRRAPLRQALSRSPGSNIRATSVATLSLLFCFRRRLDASAAAGRWRLLHAVGHPTQPKSFRAKSFRPPSEGESLSLCVLKEKVPKEKEHPAWRLPPIHGRQVREPVPGFSTAHPCAGEKESTSCRLPLRGLSSPTHRRTGAPGRAAGHRDPHFSEELE